MFLLEKKKFAQSTQVSLSQTRTHATMRDTSSWSSAGRRLFRPLCFSFTLCTFSSSWWCLYFGRHSTHSIPNAFMDDKGEIRKTLMPPRWSLYVCATFFICLFYFVVDSIALCAFEVLGAGVGVNGAGVYLGASYERFGGLSATAEGYIVRLMKSKLI